MLLWSEEIVGGWGEQEAVVFLVGEVVVRLLRSKDS